MKCPYCSHPSQKVLDSRPARDDEAIRRRRECEGCGRRFTTFEAPERPRLLVVKRDGAREEFDRDKVLKGMVVACHKRPVAHSVIQQAADRIERELYDAFELETRSTDIGERIMSELMLIDEVAFVRFASVYRAFATCGDFKTIVASINQIQKKNQEAIPVLSPS